MLGQKKEDFLFTYKNEAEKEKERERKEKIGRKMRKKRE
jgi:hypothetical protein